MVHNDDCRGLPCQFLLVVRSGGCNSEQIHALLHSLLKTEILPVVHIDIMKAARIKRGLFKKASHSNCPTTLCAAKDHQRTLKATVRVAQQCYTSRIARKAKDNPKVFWSCVSRVRTPGQSLSCSANCRTIDAPDEIAALFADRFSSVYINDEPRGSAQSAAFAPTPSLEITFSAEAVCTALSKIKPLHCPGLNGVAPAFFRTITQYT